VGNGTRAQVDEVVEEGVGGLGLDLTELLGREVAEVERHDDLSSRLDSGGEEVAVVLVGEFQSSGEVPVALDDDIPNRLTHELPGPLQPIWTKIGSVPQDAPKALVQDPICPAGVY
jgi:hypothetical protein